MVLLKVQSVLIACNHMIPEEVSKLQFTTFLYHTSQCASNDSSVTNTVTTQITSSTECTHPGVAIFTMRIQAVLNATTGSLPFDSIR